MSARLRARFIGLLYLIIFVAAPSGAKTATPMRMGVTLACDVGVALLLYDLLQPINRGVSLLAASFRLAFVVLMGVTALNYFGTTHLLQPSRSSVAFDAGYGWALVPFGAHCVLVGWLIWQSQFLPRTLGLLMALAGSSIPDVLISTVGESIVLSMACDCGGGGRGIPDALAVVFGVRQRSMGRHLPFS
jgi:hypothetical protein